MGYDNIKCNLPICWEWPNYPSIEYLDMDYTVLGTQGQMKFKTSFLTSVRKNKTEAKI